MDQKEYIRNQLSKSEVFPAYIQKFLLTSLDSLNQSQIELLAKILKEEEEKLKELK